MAAASSRPTIRRVRDRIGHVQIADAPGRNQPGTGEINYRTVLATLDEVDVLVTDDGVADADRRALMRTGLEVVVV